MSDELVGVWLWGRRIGAVSPSNDGDHATFQYDPDFAESGIEVAPLKMPLARRPYAFPELAGPSFLGLPGLLADSLPDNFGNAVIDAWLARQGRAPESFGPLERLCYVGRRGMGGLEYRPSTGPKPSPERVLSVEALVDLASLILGKRDLSIPLVPGEEEEALTDLLRVGTSAGGARAKALVAWNPNTNEIRSGQVEADSEFQHWILKFDGVEGNEDRDLGIPLGYGAIEYAYALMAREAGIEMSDVRLLEENGRRHFMTRRFDRTDEAAKLHMQSFGALAHLDYNLAGAHGYEQALRTIRKLGLPMAAVEKLFRRMVFNVLARNQDDHVKNIAFLMDKSGRWSLSPAFDVTYSYNPSGPWTSKHQMTVNGKRDGFTLADFDSVARGASMTRGRFAAIHEEVRMTVVRWMQFAEAAGVDQRRAEQIGTTHRLDLPST